MKNPDILYEYAGDVVESDAFAIDSEEFLNIIKSVSDEMATMSSELVSNTVLVTRSTTNVD